MPNVDIESRVSTLRKDIAEYEKKEVQLQTKLEAANERLSKANTQCAAHGIKPEQLDETIVKVEKQMTTLADSIEELLPNDNASGVSAAF